MTEYLHRRFSFVVRARFVIAAVLIGWHATPVTAQKPVWQTVPDDALFVVRVPAPREFYEAVKTRTKLGVVAFDERRLNAVKDVIVEDSKDDFEILATQFAKMGLETEDLLALAAGEIGYAGLTRESDAGKSSYFGLGWCECGEEAAERWLTALDKSLADQSDAKFPIRREDVELGGVAVRHLVAPHLNTDDRQFGINLEASDGQIDIFKKDDQQKPDAARNDKSVVVTGCVHLLIGRFQNKLLALHTMPQIAPGDEPDAETLAELERSTGDTARAAMAGWLEAQTGGGEGVVQRWLQTPGLAAALPEGVPALEILGDLKAAVAQLGASGAQEGRQLLEALGLDGVGPAGYRIALDGTTLRSGTFFSVPEPRRGVLAVLDEAMPLPPQPADWVAADVLGYQHLSLDFGKAYRQVTDVLRRNSPEAEKSIANIEAQVQDFLQTDVVSLLSSLGDKHMLVSFLPDAAVAAAKEDEPQQNNFAFVWRITDEALWKRLLQMAALVAGQQVKQEQGFSGLRHETPQFSGGWFVGDGTMILAFGKGVTEKTLAMLRRPPALGDSLAGSPQARRATELVSARNAVTYEITNGSSALHFMNQAAGQMLAETSDPALKRLKEAWPTEDEMKDLVGVSAAATYVDQHGLTHRSVSELPAP